MYYILGMQGKAASYNTILACGPIHTTPLPISSSFSHETMKFICSVFLPLTQTEIHNL